MRSFWGSKKKTAPSREDIIMASRAPNRKERKFIENRLKVPIHRFVDMNSYLTAGTKQVWASFRACHITASTLLSTVFKVTSSRVNAEGERYQEAVNNRELDNLMGSPNDHDSWEDMLYMWTFHLKLCGVAYWLKDEEVAGKPTKLWPLLPQHVKVEPHPTEKIGKFIYSVNGLEIEFQPEEILHFRRPHPQRIIGGLGDVEGGEPLYNDFINRDVLEEKFLENGAQPSGVLSKKGEPITDEEEWSRLKAWWRSDHEGKKNAGKTAILNSEWSFQKLGLTAQEMQSIEREKLTVEHIFLNHGVPLSVAGFTNASNYATARQDQINFRRTEVVPLLDLFVGKMNHGKSGLLPLFNEDWKLSYELSGLVDTEQVWKDYGEALRVGVISLNEMRELLGLPVKDDPWLDQHVIPNQYVPLEMAGMANAGQIIDPSLDSPVEQPSPNAARQQ